MISHPAGSSCHADTPGVELCVRSGRSMRACEGAHASAALTQHLTDFRRGKDTRLLLIDLLRQSVYSRMAGYEDVNDAERPSQDPKFRLIGSEKIWERGTALTSRSQTELLAQEDNLAGPATINRELIGKVDRFAPTGGAGHGFHRHPRLWPRGAQRLQPASRVHLLPPAVAIQSGG